jgi:tetratricopeptide (TPR) repeat protein
VIEIMAEDGVKSADDYYRAAMIFQHGEKPEEYDHAHEWCLKALELDPDHPMARWLAAASKDRALMWRGKPQLYGTQFKKVEEKWILWEVDPSISDEERVRWDVPPLSVARKRAEQLNAGTFQPH